VSIPLSPPAENDSAKGELPAYVSNGLLGLRVLDIPVLPGVVLVNGFAGLEPVVQVEAAARAPYPLAADICLNDVWLQTSPHQAEFVDQRYEFANGELTTRFRFRTTAATADVEVLTFCSQKQPTIALQELAVRVSAPCDLSLRAIVDPAKVHGRMARRNLTPPGMSQPSPDGSMAWESLGRRRGR